MTEPDDTVSEIRDQKPKVQGFKLRVYIRSITALLAVSHDDNVIDLNALPLQ